jgi:hypothetical protein
MITIHTFGNSHAIDGWENIKIPNVIIKTNSIGPRLMYSFGRDKLDKLNISDPKYHVKSGDYVCFCFGEIDARCQIYKYKESYESNIINLLDMYMEAIAINLQQIQGVIPMVLSVTPTVNTKLYTDTSMGDHPHLGTDQERRLYTTTINNLLREKCKELNYIYVDVYDKYSDSDGLLIWDLSDHRVHIKNPCYLEEFILKHLT